MMKVENLKECFDELDLKNTGTLEIKDIKKALTSMNFDMIGDSAAWKILAELDKNDDGVIDFKEFSAFMLSLDI